MKTKLGLFNRFNLYETLLVFVILALVAIAMLSGQKVTQQARDKRIWADIEKYLAAYATFELMHNSVPGDTEDAYMLWGEMQDIGCIDESVLFTPNGCNGNGDSEISPMNEEFRAWQHLALSNLIDYNFTGAKDKNSIFKTSINVPQGAYPNSMYRLLSYQGTNGVLFETTDQTAGFPIEIILNLEDKLDDGNPETGKIYGLNDESNKCLTPEGNRYIDSAPKDAKCKIFFPTP